MIRTILCLTVALASLACLPRTAHAAQSYDACSGTIASLPATITTQGVWCLKSDLSTNIASGAAITINANNVTIDCNDFKLGGLAAGPGSLAIGIRADGRQNAVVRNCNVRGFRHGISLRNGAGHLVEDNRLDNNLYLGIEIACDSGCDNSLIRGNRVFDTGGATDTTWALAIVADGADVVGNTIRGVSAGTPNSGATITLGIYDANGGILISGNRIGGLTHYGSTPGYAGAQAIVPWTGSAVNDNVIINLAPVFNAGIYWRPDLPGPAALACRNNQIHGFNLAISGGVPTCAAGSDGNLAY